MTKRRRKKFCDEVEFGPFGEKTYGPVQEGTAETHPRRIYSEEFERQTEEIALKTIAAVNRDEMSLDAFCALICQGTQQQQNPGATYLSLLLQRYIDMITP